MQGRPERLDDLVGEAAEVATAILERIEDRDPGSRVTDHDRATVARDRLGVRQAEEVADGVGREDVATGRQELVQDRLRVAHPPVGEAGNELDCRRLGGPPIGLQDAAQLPLDQRERKRTEVEPLDPGDHGGADLGAVGGTEDEEDVRRGLFEGLEQDVPTLRDPLDLVDDEDLRRQVGGRRVDARQELADIVDPVVRGRVQLDDVERPALADRVAAGTRVARLAAADIRTVDGLGHDAGERRLARAPRPDEQVGVCGSAAPDRVSERGDHGLLAHDLGEAL